MKMMKEQSGCTFKPAIEQSSHTISKALFVDYSQMNTRAIEKFIERQLEAKQRKIDLELQIQRKAGSGNVWKPKLTKPVTPRAAKDASLLTPIKEIKSQQSPDKQAQNHLQIIANLQPVLSSKNNSPAKKPSASKSSNQTKNTKAQHNFYQKNK